MKSYSKEMGWLNYNLIKSMKRGGGLDGPSGPPTTGEISRILVCFWPCPLRTKKEGHLKPMGGFCSGGDRGIRKYHSLIKPAQHLLNVPPPLGVGCPQSAAQWPWTSDS